MSVQRYTVRLRPFGHLEETPDGPLVHYSDYEKLVQALRNIRGFASSYAREIAEAALLSAGEEL